MSSQGFQTTHNNTSLAIILAFLPAIVTFIYRSWFAFSTNLLILCLGPVLLVYATILLFIWVLLSKQYLAVGLLIFTTISSIFIPIIYPEQIHLALHRADYQAVVELARQHQLDHQGDCQYAFVLPEKYVYLSQDDSSCIFAEYDPALVVVFMPLFPRTLLVYTDTQEAIHNYISCGGSDGFIARKLEKHWYICIEDWN
jgi:Zn-dependent protease with chaperone function